MVDRRRATHIAMMAQGVRSCTCRKIKGKFSDSGHTPGRAATCDDDGTEARGRARSLRSGAVTRSDDSEVPDYASMVRLDGRRFIVLGAGNGIGRQTAHALASVGARLVCVDRDGDLAHDVADEVGGTPWVGDATRRAEMERLFSEGPAVLGGLDGVVDIIGMSHYASLLDV